MPVFPAPITTKRSWLFVDVPGVCEELVFVDVSGGDCEGLVFVDVPGGDCEELVFVDVSGGDCAGEASCSSSPGESHRGGNWIEVGG